MGDQRIGGNQPSTQLGPPRKLERTVSTIEIRTGQQTGKHLNGAILRRTDSGHLPKLPPKDLISDTRVQQEVETGIDATASQALITRTTATPTPLALMKARAQLSPTITVEQTGLEHAQKVFSKDSEHAGDSAPRPSQRQGMSDQAFNQGVAGLFSPKLVQFERAYLDATVQAERELPGQLQEAFRAPLNTYLKATNALIGSKTDVDAVKTLRQAASDWAAAQSKDGDIGVLLGQKGDLELRRLASDLLAAHKGYSPKEMTKLSERKQDLINAVAIGLREGIMAAQAAKDEPDKPAGQLGKIKANLQYASAELQKSIVALPADSPLRRELIARSPEQFGDAIRAQLGAKSPELMRTLLDAAHSPLVSENLVSGQVPGTAGLHRAAPTGLPPELAGLTLPDSITIKGVTYTAPRFLASGGFADVFTYSNPRHPSDQIVVKRNRPLNQDDQATPDLPDPQAQMIAESRAQLALQGERGHRNITGIKALVRDGGEVLAVQEFVGGGDLQALNDKLWDLKGKGLVNDDLHRLMSLALIKDSLEGMRYIHNEQQGHHFDLKLPNLMLSEAGVAKIADFGYSGIGQDRRIASLAENDNPLYKSPEMIEAGHYKQSRPDARVDQRADTWNAGVLAYTLLIEPNQKHKIWDSNFLSAIEVKMAEFAGSPDNRIMNAQPLPDGRIGAGVGAINMLINGLMHPQANQRSNFEAALQSSLFQDPRLDKPQLRQLLALVGTTRPENMDQGFEDQLARLAGALKA